MDKDPNMHEISINTQQRQKIVSFLEDSIDRQSERVDDDSIIVQDLGAKNLRVSYILIQSAGCAGPSNSHQFHCSLPHSVIQDSSNPN